MVLGKGPYISMSTASRRFAVEKSWSFRLCVTWDPLLGNERLMRTFLYTSSPCPANGSVVESGGTYVSPWGVLEALGSETSIKCRHTRWRGPAFEWCHQSMLPSRGFCYGRKSDICLMLFLWVAWGVIQHPALALAFAVVSFFFKTFFQSRSFFIR